MIFEIKRYGGNDRDFSAEFYFRYPGETWARRYSVSAPTAHLLNMLLHQFSLFSVGLLPPDPNEGGKS